MWPPYGRVEGTRLMGRWRRPIGLTRLRSAWGESRIRPASRLPRSLYRPLLLPRPGRTYKNRPRRCETCDRPVRSTSTIAMRGSSRTNQGAHRAGIQPVLEPRMSVGVLHQSFTARRDQSAMPEKEKDFNKGEKRPAPPRSTSDEQKRKIGSAATYLANKDKKLGGVHRSLQRPLDAARLLSMLTVAD